MRTISLGIATAGVLAGCNPSSFEEYLDTAPIRVSSAPGSFRDGRYGQGMVALNGTLDGVPVGRVVVSGVGRTPLAFVRSYESGKVSESTFVRCKQDGTKPDCPNASDIGATLIPFERWGIGTTDERELCVFAPANGTQAAAEGDPRPGGNGYVACESPSNQAQSFALGPQITDVRGDEGLLRYSGFGLPPEHPLGVVLLGVHAIDTRTSAPRNGGLYLLPELVYSETQRKNIVPYLGLVPLVDPTTGKPYSEADDADDFGARVAGLADGKDLTFAIAQPSKGRVIVASYDDALPGDVAGKFRVHACLRGDERGFGKQLVVADLTNDGAPEIIVATDEQKLLVYDGRSLPGPATESDCPAWNDQPEQVPCAMGQGPSCDSFGSSLAVGDVDADGFHDLIIGAPEAALDGVTTGAVWIVPGSSAGADVGRAVAITVPSKEGARFGEIVSALRTKDRDEPVVSAPGVSEVYTLMCTPLESGFGGDGLCLE